MKGLPQDLRDRHPEVPWRDITGARDVLVHEYFRIDLDLAWDMVKKDIPHLAEQVKEILGEFGRWEAISSNAWFPLGPSGTSPCGSRRTEPI